MTNLEFLAAVVEGRITRADQSPPQLLRVASALAQVRQRKDGVLEITDFGRTRLKNAGYSPKLKKPSQTVFLKSETENTVQDAISVTPTPEPTTEPPIASRVETEQTPSSTHVAKPEAEKTVLDDVLEIEPETTQASIPRKTEIRVSDGVPHDHTVFKPANPAVNWSLNRTRKLLLEHPGKTIPDFQHAEPKLTRDQLVRCLGFLFMRGECYRSGVTRREWHWWPSGQKGTP